MRLPKSQVDVQGATLDHHLHAVTGTEAVVIVGVAVTADPDHLQRESTVWNDGPGALLDSENLHHHHHRKRDTAAPHLMRGALGKEARRHHRMIDHHQSMAVLKMEEAAPMMDLKATMTERIGALLLLKGMFAVAAIALSVGAVKLLHLETRSVAALQEAVSLLEFVPFPCFLPF